MNREDSDPHQAEGNRWIYFLVAAAILVLFVAIRETHQRRDDVRRGLNGRRPLTKTRISHRGEQRPPGPARLSAALPPKEMVANKMNQFVNQRREMTYAFAAKKGLTVPPEVQAFYEAVEAGDWKLTNDLFDKMWKKKNSDEPGAETLRDLSGPLLETYGVAEQVHAWDPAKLLEYGQSILDALKPGMVYIGGTDTGRFIPTLLNETTEDGERHVIITQNALADGSYTDYLRFLYGDQLSALDKEDSDRAFQEYITDATKRLEHDRDFPDEPKQIRKGEDVKMKDGKIDVSGQVAVMDINERLLNAFMKKNPEMTFAIEESFSLKSTYGAARPLGPIFEIGAADGASALTGKAADETVDYWNKKAQELSSETPVAAGDDGYSPRKSYSHLAAAQANLFGNRGLIAQSEQAYRMALQIWPGNIAAANEYYAFLMAQGRSAEAKAFLNARLKDKQ